MKKISFALIALVTISALSFTSCKKGDDDPLLSLKSRTARLSQTWQLEEFKENGATVDLGDATFIWDFEDNGNIKETQEGVFFGVQTSETREGSWAFQNDKEQLKVVFDSETDIYVIDRLASKDLWVRQTDGSDVYEWIFESK